MMSDNNITKNLGHATAYGYAKSKGYTGTEEEFAELMASYAEVGQAAAASAQEAQTAKTEADVSAANAQHAAAAAGTSAQAAGEAAREALAGAGTPLVAQTAAAMTDTSKIYVYLGSETGYTSGNWYYYNGSAWTSGGVYNAQALETDTTLTLPGRAADADAVGRNLRQFNAADLMSGLLTMSTATNEGVTYTWTGRTCTLTGGTDAEHTSYHVLIPFRTVMPDYIRPGQTYALRFATTNTGTNYAYRLRVIFYNSENTQVGETMYLPIGRNITIPDGAAKWFVSLYVTSSVTMTGTVTFSDPCLLSAPTNAELQAGIDTLAEGLGEIAPVVPQLEADGRRYGAVNMADGHYNRTSATTNGIRYVPDGESWKVWGTASAFSARVVTQSGGITIADYAKPGQTVYIKYKTTNTNVGLRVSTSDGETWTYVYGILQDQPFRIPDDAVKLSLSIYVYEGRSAGTEDDPTIVSDIRILTAQTNAELSAHANYAEPDRPVYVSIGASTTIGAVHYYDETHDDASYHSVNNFPDYTGAILGLETYNLAYGGTGLLQRTSYNLDNFMDVIYKNDALLSRAKLVTMYVGYGNDAMTPTLPIGVYDDYYPYDEEGYHPANYEGCAQMIALGATWCGCLNWCLKWLGDHYPLAQVIVLYGGSSLNQSRRAELNAAHNKVIFTDAVSASTKTVHTEWVKIMDALGLAKVDMFADGMPYTYYGAQTKDANGDYILFSTVKQNGVKVINNHPSDAGYLLLARHMAGRIAALYDR